MCIQNEMHSNTRPTKDINNKFCLMSLIHTYMTGKHTCQFNWCNPFVYSHANAFKICLLFNQMKTKSMHLTVKCSTVSVRYIRLRNTQFVIFLAFFLLRILIDFSVKQVLSNNQFGANCTCRHRHRQCINKNLYSNGWFYFHFLMVIFIASEWNCHCQ